MKCLSIQLFIIKTIGLTLLFVAVFLGNPNKIQVETNPAPALREFSWQWEKLFLKKIEITIYDKRLEENR